MLLERVYRGWLAYLNKENTGRIRSRDDLTAWKRTLGRWFMKGP